MLNKTTNESVTSKLVFEENEKKSFLMLGSIAIIFSLIEFLFLIISFILEGSGYTVFLFLMDKYLLMFTAIINMTCGVIAFSFTKYAKRLKYIISFFIILTVAALDFSFSYFVIGLILIPAIASVRFYDKKFIIYNIVLTTVMLFLSFVGIYLYNLKYPESSQSYIINFHIDPKNFGLNFVFYYLIKIVTLLTCFFICTLLVLNGKKMIKKQAKISSEISSYETDLKTASNIQSQVLPKDFEICKPCGIDLYASMKPAKNVGGDFYDFFQVGNNFFFLIGDVSDKGLHAAMFMMNVKNIIRSLAVYLKDLEYIINEANKIISKDNKNFMFVTLWIGCLDIKTKKGYYINAGHNPVLLIHKNRKIEKLISKPQSFIGTFSDYVYKKTPFVLKKSEYIYLYTDGVTDAINKDNIPFKEGGIISCINEPFLRPIELCNIITNKIREHCEGVEQYDDISMLCIGNFEFDFDKMFPANSTSIIKIMDSLNNNLKTANVSKDLINSIDSAIDDLLDNIITYAYKDKNNKFRFQYKIDSSLLTIVVTDKGTPFNPLDAVKPNLSKNRPIGGLGIHIIKKIMTTFEYSRNNNENISVLTKNIR